MHQYADVYYQIGFVLDQQLLTLLQSHCLVQP